MKHPALDMAAAGLSVIPLRHQEKVPAIPWVKYQTTRATADVVEDWCGRTGSFGVVTGAISGIVVIDADGPDGLRAAHELGVPVTPTVTTGKGRHYWVKHPGGTVSNRAGMRPGLDVRGDGGFVVAPPSVHPNGTPYRWVDGLGLGDVPLAECPAWLLTASQGPVAPRPDDEWADMFSRTVRWGEQNDTCVRLTGYLLRKGVAAGAAEAIMQSWALTRCEPPLSAREVERTVRSIVNREERRRT